MEEISLSSVPDTLPLSCYRILGDFSSCSDVLTQYPDAVSGYYNIILNNGSIASVYCDMEGDNCDGEGRMDESS